MERPPPSRFVDYTQPSPAGYRGSSSSSHEYYPERIGPRERSRSRERERHPNVGKEVYLSSRFNGNADLVVDSESDDPARPEGILHPSWQDERRGTSRTVSEIYASSRYPKSRSESSHYGYPSSHPSDVASVKTKTTRAGRLVVETMSSPHPLCPNTRGICCLMVLLNLGLILITLGFVVVLQLYDPPFVWYVGLSMLIFGFMVIFGSLIYCIFVCREAEELRPPPGELYWTHHWTKSINTPEIDYSKSYYKQGDYKGSEFSFKTEPSRTTGTGTATTSRY